MWRTPGITPTHTHAISKWGGRTEDEEVVGGRRTRVVFVKATRRVEMVRAERSKRC